MASKGEVVTLGPRPLPRIWGTALSSFPVPEGVEWEPDEFGIKRWLNGVTFVPFGCDKSVGDTIDPCVERLTNYLETGGCVDFYPFLAEFAVEGRVGLHDPDTLQAYVLAHSEISRSARLAEQLETAAYNPLSPSLASEAQVITNGDQSLLGALIAVEDALADVLDGGSGMIHIPASFLTALQAGGGLRYDKAGRPYTATGHLIVADAGTLGVSPVTGEVVEGETWIYGSGPVMAKYDDAVTVVGQREWERMNFTRNRFYMDAELYGIVFFEPCSVVAATVNTSDDDIVSEGGAAGGATAANQEELLALANPTIVPEEVAADESITAANWLWGYTFQETAGDATASITIHNGDANTDPVIGYINLAAGESIPPTMLPIRIPAPDGIFVEVVTGAVEGTIFYEA
jgi:hypothetical protein